MKMQAIAATSNAGTLENPADARRVIDELGKGRTLRPNDDVDAALRKFEGELGLRMCYHAGERGDERASPREQLRLLAASDAHCVAQIDGGVPDARGAHRRPDQRIGVHAHHDAVKRSLVIEYEDARARVCRAVKVGGKGLGFRNEADHDGEKFALQTLLVQQE
jgi:hypothetical protein